METGHNLGETAPDYPFRLLTLDLSRSHISITSPEAGHLPGAGHALKHLSLPNEAFVRMRGGMVRQGWLPTLLAGASDSLLTLKGLSPNDLPLGGPRGAGPLHTCTTLQLLEIKTRRKVGESEWEDVLALLQILPAQLKSLHIHFGPSDIPWGSYLPILDLPSCQKLESLTIRQTSPADVTPDHDALDKMRARAKEMGIKLVVMSRR